MQKVDLVGQKYGKLTVLEDTGDRQNGAVVWLCRCDCGGIKKAKASKLKSGDVASCGCLRKDVHYNKPKVYSFKDLTGIRFGRLLVLKTVGLQVVGTQTKRFWECLCDCGNRIIVASGNLTVGNTKSCGCYGRDQNRISQHKRRKEISDDNLTGRHYTHYKHTAKGRKIDFKLDLEEFTNLISQNCFYCGEAPNNIVRSRKGGDKRFLLVSGIDRVDSLGCYEISNCVSCCKQCNKAKNTLGQEEFFIWISKVFNTLKNKNML